MPAIIGATRKSHTKSRNGCATCKRRHIRCDEGRPQWWVREHDEDRMANGSKNCVKHQVRSVVAKRREILLMSSCDFVASSPQPADERPLSRGPNLLSTPAIEQDLERWRSSQIFPFPEMKLENTQQFGSLTRLELRLIHHLASVYRDMRLADFVQCTLWVQYLPA